MCISVYHLFFKITKIIYILFYIVVYHNYKALNYIKEFINVLYIFLPCLYEYDIFRMQIKSYIFIFCTVYKLNIIF